MGIPATQGNRYTEDENEVIRRLFPELGTAGVRIYLPHRSMQSVQKQANRLAVYKRDDSVRRCYRTGPREQPPSMHPHWPATPGAQLVARIGEWRPTP